MEEGGGPNIREKGAICLDMPRWFGCPTPCPRERLLTETPSDNTVPAVSSLAVSPQGDSSFVVMTNFIVTPGQKQGTCPEVNALASFSGLSSCHFGGLWWWHWGRSFPDVERFRKSLSPACECHVKAFILLTNGQHPVKFSSL